MLPHSSAAPLAIESQHPPSRFRTYRFPAHMSGYRPGDFREDHTRPLHGLVHPHEAQRESILHIDWSSTRNISQTVRACNRIWAGFLGVSPAMTCKGAQCSQWIRSGNPRRFGLRSRPAHAREPKHKAAVGSTIWGEIGHFVWFVVVEYDIDIETRYRSRRRDSLKYAAYRGAQANVTSAPRAMRLVPTDESNPVWGAGSRSDRPAMVSPCSRALRRHSPGLSSSE